MTYILNLYISTFRSLCAVPNMAVFCSALTSCFLYVAQVFVVIIIIILNLKVILGRKF